MYWQVCWQRKYTPFSIICQWHYLKLPANSTIKIDYNMRLWQLENSLKCIIHNLQYIILFYRCLFYCSISKLYIIHHTPPSSRWKHSMNTQPHNTVMVLVNEWDRFYLYENMKTLLWLVCLFQAEIMHPSQWERTCSVYMMGQKTVNKITQDGRT